MHVRMFAVPAILFFTFATFGAKISRAQDQQDPKTQQEQSVAEAARKERARKEELQKRAKHVYTEEDLKHPNILTPEDRAQIEAKRRECAQKNNCSPADAQNSPATLDANSPAKGNAPAALDGNSPAAGTSLGEVARQLRKQKELQALKPKQTEPFHLPFETPALASPILPERPAIRAPAQPVLRPKPSSPKHSSPKTPSNVFRRDPFSSVAVPAPPRIRKPEVRRPEVARPEIHPSIPKDIRPEVREETFSAVHPNVHPDFSKIVRPTLRAHGRLTVPAQPKLSSHPAQPTLLLQPMQPAAPSNAIQPVAPSSPVSTISPAQPAASATAVSTQKSVTVQRGDSLWKLAQENLGRGSRYTELLAANPSIVDPNKVRAGAQLLLPAVAASSAARAAGSNSAMTIQVRKGDTLWSLAKSKLGRSNAWPCLAAANPSLRDPNRIHEGQMLVLPSACTPLAPVPHLASSLN